MELSIFAVFGAGVLTFLSPCVLPLIPVYLGILAGSQSDDAARGKFAAVAATLLFALGFTLVFSMMGLSATVLGRALVKHKLLFQQLGGVVIMLLGLRFMGYLKIPFMEGDGGSGMSSRLKTRFHYVNVFVLGVFFAFAWTPCIGSVLGAVLTWTSLTTTSPLEGMAYLTFYGLGFAVPLLVVSAFAGPALVALKKARRFIPVFERTTGILMVIIGLALTTDQVGLIDSAFPQSPGSAFMEIPADPSGSESTGQDAQPGGPETLSLAGQDGSAAASCDGSTIPDGSKASSCDADAQPGQPAMIKFFSPNCAICRQMIPTVNMLKHECRNRAVQFREVDVLSPEGRMLARNYGIRGIPVFLFIDDEGREVSRLVGFQQLATLEQAMTVLTGENCPTYRPIQGM
jgi:cytochrome c-type biogenesis protein